ncbi:hypothetical protein EJ05DRAFT_224319 [Pseudovirgaria hyperparasitica]|uniref:CFEM domain-containing protein n=1 Tax=Pseudovirgaria hyperparasitica TaxID=470096 RepID=A0A6A6VTN4_9PEZI|nr:uncharacterized protein EJ05DRAFT_224319 [Pseudovirgaria hyperparasitica]KAF2753249.1 hypothetical protein EJ05DRAFT_224319 [Pseudovirgaria hyperparasitica]
MANTTSGYRGSRALISAVIASLNLGYVVGYRVETVVTLVQTTVWINTLSAYSALPTCAQTPINNVVRNMENGCGDGNRLTSFSCFCSESSSAFNTIISRAVQSECANDAAVANDVGNAMNVFAEYCRQSPIIRLGAATITTEITEIHQTAAPASSTSLPTSTSFPSSGISAQTRIAIAIPVVIGAALLLLAIVAGFLYLRRSHEGRNQSQSWNDRTTQSQTWHGRTNHPQPGDNQTTECQTWHGRTTDHHPFDDRATQSSPWNDSYAHLIPPKEVAGMQRYELAGETVKRQELPENLAKGTLHGEDNFVPEKADSSEWEFTLPIQEPPYPPAVTQRTFVEVHHWDIPSESGLDTIISPLDERYGRGGTGTTWLTVPSPLPPEYS